MAKAKLHLVYNRKTGRYEILCDMEQETLNEKVHNRAHDRLVREFAGSEAKIEVAGPGEQPAAAESEPERPHAGQRPVKQGQ